LENRGSGDKNVKKIEMGETFVITVLSFALVLAVVAALLVWVILPALNEDEDAETKTKELTIADYIDDINAINESAYDYDTEQQKAIEDNADDIQELRDDIASMSTAAPAAASGGAVSTSTEASATFDGGEWIITDGSFTYKATPTHLCTADGDCTRIALTGEETASSS